METLWNSEELNLAFGQFLTETDLEMTTPSQSQRVWTSLPIRESEVICALLRLSHTNSQLQSTCKPTGNYLGNNGPCGHCTAYQRGPSKSRNRCQSQPERVRAGILGTVV